MKILTKPLKDWNAIDLGIASIGAIALIPVGFWVTGKSMEAVDKIDEKLKTRKTEAKEEDRELN